jgi:O-antigen ligase
MSAWVETWVPPRGWWAMLALVIAAGLIGNWFIAAGLLVLMFTQMARPLDFVTAFLVVVAGASFISNAGGRLTFQLGLLTCAILLMLVVYVMSTRGRVLALPRTTLTWPVLLFLVLSIANAARGFAAGYSRRNWGLELIALLALGSALLVANAFDRRRDLRLAIVGLVAIGIAAAGRGFYDFAVTKQIHTRLTTALAVPGIIALLLVNLALRSRTPLSALGWIVLSIPLFTEQFISFGRGLWTAGIAGLAFSVLTFARFGRGSAVRWRRVGLVFVMLAGLTIAMAIQVAIALGRLDIIGEAGSRVASITNTSTEMNYGARSNLIRLGEYLDVIRYIRQSPWVGHGVGFTFVVKQAFSKNAGEQWGVHQNYLLVWLKQGLLGLALFVWMLLAAIVQGAREAGRHPDPWESTWFAATAAATVHLAVFSISGYPFASVNETFLLAFLWGGTMAMTHKGLILFQWSPARATTDRVALETPE